MTNNVEETFKNKSVKERMWHLMALLGFKSIRSFATKAGVTQQTLNKIMSESVDKNTLPGFDTIEKIGESFPRVNLNWVVKGEGQPLRAYKGSEEFEAGMVNESTGNYNATAQGSSSVNQNFNFGLPECIKRLQLLEQSLSDKDKIIQLLEKQVSKQTN